MRKRKSNKSPKQQPRTEPRVGAKNLAHKLGIKPNTLRKWLRRHGAPRCTTRPWTWSASEGAQLIANHPRARR
jgi:uncharacterized protein YjcR